MTASNSLGDTPGLGTLQRLFSVVMVLNRELTIVHSSDTLIRHLPDITEAPKLTELLDPVRPRALQNYESVSKHLNSLFLFVARDQSFAIRGQMIQKTWENEQYLVFCGAPWLSWLLNHRPDLKLGLNDFSAQDVQFDQLFYMTTEKQMVEDLEALNDQLKRAKEEAESAQAVKNAFFAQMSHEMRTPLNGVVSALSLIKEQDLSGRAKELLDLASKSSANLMQVINYVLDISKLESAYSPPENIEFDLRELVTSVTDIVRARALEKGLELRCDIGQGLAATYLGDATRLRQTLLNLMINAIKFTEAGEVSLLVSKAQLSDHTLRFEVNDTGIGINEKDQQSVFQPFSTLESGLPGIDHQGTGLGLDIAKRNIDSMLGQIGVISKAGSGSSFWIELPFKAVAKTLSAYYEATPVVDQEILFRGRVLLVDDNDINLMLGTMLLEDLGVSVATANSGEQAVELAVGEDFDLVLMDISMPGIDGFEATRRICADEGGQDIPVVALSAYASSVEQEKSRACGMRGYLTKPIEREKLLSTLETWLLRKGKDEQLFADEQAVIQEPVRLDREVLGNLLKQIGRERLSSIILKFCDEADRRWRTLQLASNNNDVVREAHTLASTCRSFGLPEVADALNVIEAQANTPVGSSSDFVAETGQKLNRGMLALKAELSNF